MRLVYHLPEAGAMYREAWRMDGWTSRAPGAGAGVDWLLLPLQVGLAEPYRATFYRSRRLCRCPTMPISTIYNFIQSSWAGPVCLYRPQRLRLYCRCCTMKHNLFCCWSLTIGLHETKVLAIITADTKLSLHLRSTSVSNRASKGHNITEISASGG